MRLSPPARRLLAAGSLALAASCGGGGGGGGGGPLPVPEPFPISLVPVASGLTAPVFLTHAGDGTGRLFVVDQPGTIRVIDATGTLLPTPFLDLAGKVVTVDPTFDERGALGIAFHPSYAQNGRFFVRYSAPRVGAPGEPCLLAPQYGCDSAVVSEFAVVGDPATSNVADPASERVLLRVDKPQFNHNGGQIVFGPDGLLYVSLGDGGGANDGLADTPPSHGPIGNGQDVQALLGKILRIDVDGTPDPGLQYRIPLGNPFAFTLGADEIYAYGFRNPYRFSFDDRPGGTDALYVGDVGQDLEEEVDVVVNGGNYGWAIREGSLCFDPVVPQSPPPSCPTTGLGGAPLLDPVLSYSHTLGLAVIGGYVYRGSALPALQGRFVFGDFSADFGPTGQLFHAATTGPLAWERRTFELPGAAPLGRYLLGIGQDAAGELYMLVSQSLGPTGTTGQVLRLAPQPP